MLQTHQQIAGAAVGSVVGIVAALLIAEYFVLRKWERQRPNTGLVDHEKPMLHSDDFQPDLKEVPGDKSALKDKATLWNESMAEMPANEITGAELDASFSPERR
jgi:hypothetical protein